MEDFDIRPDNLQEYLASVRAALDLVCRIVLQSGKNEVAGFDWPRPDRPGHLFAMLSLPALLHSTIISHSGFSTVSLRGEF
jgi:hypothetical protein